MAKVPFIFAKIDVNYADHPKIAALSDGAFRAHVEMILYARKYLTDGIIPNRFANRFGSEVITELVSNDENRPSLRPVLDKSGRRTGYQLHDFLSMQDSKVDAEARSQINRANGAKGGRPPKTHSVTESLTETETETETETKPESESESESDLSTSDTRSDVSAEFDQFWDLYPRKDGKKRARDRFVAARKRASLDEILDGVRRYCTALPADRSKIKMAEGWLAGDRWDDPAPIVAIHPGETGIAGGDVQQLAGGVTLQVVNGTRWYRAPDGRTWTE